VDPRTLAILEPFLDKHFISYQGTAYHHRDPSAFSRVLSDLREGSGGAGQSVNAGQAIFIFISNAAALESALTDQEAESAMRYTLYSSQLITCGHDAAVSSFN
jgi:hypothetical protein